MRPFLSEGVQLLFFPSFPSSMPAPSSSQGPLPVAWDYMAESKAKYPLPDYPWEDDYEDAVCYEAACNQYKVEKLQVLDDWEEWREWEQVADMACTAAAACTQAEEQAAASSTTQPARKHHQAESSNHLGTSQY